ncbi:DUF1223 domain-containing protein [Maritimibacter sp. 55A14]|uniref:DUF1223 domain-containing protein n=1 Tax=Maritimibacter sp. 55A14 TaxID=2174844 RepID=UPI000D61BC19|nr:DUF1223 domain-containing protein [Maritimibacter sp. 55A14]PWE34402.1 DUF1223 domain-containing protein [Maritimibacter sp. 55A14]
MRLLSAAILSLSLTATPLVAETEPVVVVELFTSQGCSSCPPADAYLGQLAERDDVIALALHVDYWDYIGWKDIFATPSHTERQRAYAQAAGTSTIYTPQIVVNGQKRLMGAHRENVDATIEEQKAEPAPVDIRLERIGDRLSIELTAEAMESVPCVVQLVRYDPKQTVKIERGENAGREIDYHNIVTNWTDLGVWDGGGNWSTEVEITGDAPVAVIVQAEAQGPILAAARLR